MPTDMKSAEQFHAETEALLEWADRVASGYPDWRIYWPGDERPPPLPWWRRLLKL